MTMNAPIDHPVQAALREKHADLLADIDLIAERANAVRRVPGEHGAAILEAAEVALIRVSDALRKSRGGHQNNYFFYPLSKRLRRIIAHYRRHAVAPLAIKDEDVGKRWLYRIVDYEQIPFHRLKAYFRASAVDDAIKMGITLGLRELPGVSIYEDQTDD